MRKFFKSINELDKEQLERRESIARNIGGKLGGAIRFITIPVYLMTSTVLFLTPATVALGLSCFVFALVADAKQKNLVDLPEKLAQPYRHALLELDRQRERDVPAVKPPVATVRPAPAAEIEFETSQDIQVMRPLVLGRKRTVFNTAATEADAYRWKIKDDAQAPGRKTPPALAR